MSITATCACGKVLKVGDQYAGKRVRCPACGQTVLIPDPAAEEVLEEAGYETPPQGQRAASINFAKAMQQLGIGGMISLAVFFIAFITTFLPWYYYKEISVNPFDIRLLHSAYPIGFKFTAGVFYFVAALAGIASAAARGFVNRQDIRRYAVFGVLGAAVFSIVTVFLALAEAASVGMVLKSPGIEGRAGTVFESGMGLGWYIAIVAACGRRRGSLEREAGAAVLNR